MTQRRLELEAVEGAGQRSIALGTGHLSIGRGPDNDLMVPHTMVSRHHALVWKEGDVVWLKDLGTANGSFVDDQRVQGVVQVPLGAEIRLGPDVRMFVRSNDGPVAPGVSALAVEDLASGLRHPLHQQRYVIGSTGEVDLRVAGVGSAVTLMVYPGHEVWLGCDGEDRPLGVGDHFEVGDASFALVPIDALQAATARSDEAAPPYHLEVALDGPRGRLAVLRDVATGSVCEITAENRVVLLFLLGRKLAEEGDVVAADRGWCADEDVVVGLWGRAAVAGGANRLKVLLHRLRKELDAAGFDPWCVEKRRGYVRMRAAAVVVA